MNTNGLELKSESSAQWPLAERAQLLIEIGQNKILVLDGGTGTKIQRRNLSALDFGGEKYEGCNEFLVITRPDVVLDLHRDYLLAGCDIVETNTFGATPLVLSEYDLAEKAYEINVKAAQIARKACSEFGPFKFVAGSMGPTTKSLSLMMGSISFDELVNHYEVQARGLWDGGVDYYLIETAPDTLNVKAALIAIEKIFSEKKARIPVAVSGTIEVMGTLLAGQTVDALLASMLHKNLFYIGLNCATGPEFMTDHIRTLSELSPFPVSCVPNAGLPDQDGKYLETPQMMASVMKNFLNHGWLNVLGGCCGTDETHIKALVELASHFKPRPLKKLNKSLLSGLECVDVTDEIRPLLVGERTNIIGSKKFKTLLQERKYEEAAEIGRAQIKSGAQIVDVCVSHPDSNEMEDMKELISRLVKLVKAPIMIDSTDENVIALALKYTQGKSIINSINLEEGEKRFEQIVPLAKNFGSALVVGTIDEDPENGMAVTRQRKLEIAQRSYELLTKKWEFKPHDIYFDPLVFPCAVGDEKYRTSAVETIEGLKLIKQKYPECKTVLGISNVSFGLPPQGREVLNSVFLYHCVQAGLDLAIVNSEKLERFTHLKENEIKLAENLLFNNSVETVNSFIEFFQDKKTEKKSDQDDSHLTLEVKLSRCVVDGTKEGLINYLSEAIKKYTPLEVINGPLMDGMDEVGKLFNDKKLIVAEVLQSAEVMKAAVAFLESYMEKKDSAKRGKIILATVKGDVHDIGKNLVDIILSNNGFQVVDLGIKVLPETLILESQKHNPDIIGLSGLLVKSAHQMVATAEDLKQAGIRIPILVGGAALSQNFTTHKIAPAYDGTVLYAQDAMKGLELAKKLMAEEKNTEFKEKNGVSFPSEVVPGEVLPNEEEVPAPQPPQPHQINMNLNPVVHPPQPPDFERHILLNLSLDEIWKYINPVMLYGRHLGIKGSFLKKLKSPASLTAQISSEDAKAHDIYMKVEEVKERFKGTPILSPKAVYQFFPATSQGNTLNLWSTLWSSESQFNAHLQSASDQLAQFHFLRQKRDPYLCLSDYVHTQRENLDNIALFVVSAGQGIREEGLRLKEAGSYLESHILQALALETAEALAEYLHSFLRKSWGFPDGPNMSMMDRFQAKYQGKRYSFGYPACPRLEDQAILFNLLKPEEIGIHLTETMMMDPEASVSAIVFHHPQAVYYTI